MQRDSLKGHVIAITGTLVHVRKWYIEFIKAMGGEYTRTFNKRVTLLVEGDTMYRTEKQFRALMNNVDVIDESTLFAIAGLTLKQYKGI